MRFICADYYETGLSCEKIENFPPDMGGMLRHYTLTSVYTDLTVTRFFSSGTA